MSAPREVLQAVWGVQDNPPDDWEECGQCGGYHPAGYIGDCRDDEKRWPSDAAIAALMDGAT